MFTDTQAHTHTHTPTSWHKHITETFSFQVKKMIRMALTQCCILALCISSRFCTFKKKSSSVKTPNISFLRPTSFHVFQSSSLLRKIGTLLWEGVELVFSLSICGSWRLHSDMGSCSDLQPGRVYSHSTAPLPSQSCELRWW